MNKIKTRLIIAVTQRLAAAAESEAKVELIEELSENLYSRYEDMVAAGAPEEEAYEKALGELGDVNELLAYLDTLGPTGKLPPQDKKARGFADSLDREMEELDKELEDLDRDLEGLDGDWKEADGKDQGTGDMFRNLGGMVRQVVDQAIDAAGDAVAMMQDAAGQLRGEFTFVADEAQRGSDGSFAYMTGDSVSWEGDISAADLHVVDVSLIDGDVMVRFDGEPGSLVRLEGETGGLQVQCKNGTLLISQGKTAGEKFFFGRMLRSTDIELVLPRQQWERLSIRTANGDVELCEDAQVRHINVNTASGDVEIHGGLKAEQVYINTASGDLNIQEASFDRLTFKSASGDFSGDGLRGELWVDTMSGDICGAYGSFPAVHCATASGDVEVYSDVLPRRMEVSSKSGDCEASVPDGAGFTVQMSTVSGEWESDFQLTGTIGKRAGQATYLGGGDCVIRLSSISGDVSLRRQP